jgi:ribonucleoside-diphosphate reductase alpha chain
MEHHPQTHFPTATTESHAGQGLSIRRYYTMPGVHPFDAVEWESRDARIGHGDKVSFEQRDVEFPKSWSQNATNIVAQKYFRGQLGTPARERSVKQMIGRVAGTIANWGRERGYFATAEDGDTFEAELTYILLHQMAAFNSPVWFNVGWHPVGSPKMQASACFILSVEDNMESILEWNTKEGIIFRGGSGSGINLSKIRGSHEPLSRGGTASGPVSFMRGADAWAGSIKSGGGTRRAAKMVVLDIDHPDIREFIWCKAKEEDKAAALRDAGFDMSIDGDGFFSIQYQNANNSVRVTDQFMRAVENDEDWHLIARTTGQPTGEAIPARELMREIAEAAWRCADPGVQYDTTINQWHTCPNSGRINASNPCCFVGETTVRTTTGEWSFDELYVMSVEGTQLPSVEAYDPATGQLVTRDISRVWIAGMANRLTSIQLEEGTVVRCTPEHRFLTTSGDWRSAEALTPGTELRATRDKGRADLPYMTRTVTTLAVREARTEDVEVPLPVFDMEVDTVHNFVVSAADGSGVVAHNSEYMHVDDSACNLASLNLMKFRRADGTLDVHSFEHAVDIMFLAQEIVVSPSSYPTEQIASNARAFRQLGLGYANLGAYLMADGVPYDSDAGRGTAAAITALMTGRGYLGSARIASAMGPYNRYAENRGAHNAVMRMHRDASYAIPDSTCADTELISAARSTWDEAVRVGEMHGYRNAQATVLAPTGCLVAGSLISTSRGLVRLRTLGNPDGPKWQDLDIQVATDEGPRQATKFYVNGMEQVVSIETMRGFRIQGTPTHRIKVIDEDGNWTWRRMIEVREGDRVPMMLGGLVGDPCDVPLPPLGDLHWNADHRSRVPRHMNPELAEFVGYFMGDGSLHAKGIRMCVADGDADVVERLLELGQELFGLDGYTRQCEGYVEVGFHSVPLTMWWDACGFAKLRPDESHRGKGSVAHIPDAILHSNDHDVYAAFVRGLFEADGNANHGYVYWLTSSEEFSRDVQTLLLALGFVSTRDVQDSWGRLGGPAHRLRLLNASSAARFVNEISFISERKNEALSFDDHPQAARYDQIPMSRTLVDELAPENDNLRKAMLGHLARTGTVSRRSATALLERAPSVELENLLGYFYDAVASTDLQEDQPTFDLSVPDNVTYVANGFVSHNTISFLMDCDTTGVEPDFSLVKFKELVGGGQMTIVNRTVPLALQTLGYGDEKIEQIVAYVNEHGTIIGAPDLNPEHLPVFDVAVGERAISHVGHIKMMGAVQPFLSGAISKTVNLPETATVVDIADAYLQAWRMGIKALAIYRDGSKTAQALRTDAQKDAPAPAASEADVEKAVAEALAKAPPKRRRMPRERQSITHKFSIGGHEGYITAGMYEDGTVGEIFLTDIGKEGSTLRGMMNSFATAISIALQYGVPLETLVRKFSYMRFEPEGMTSNPEIPFAKSMPDYIMRWLASRFLDVDLQEELGILTPEVRARKAAQDAASSQTGDTAGPPAGAGADAESDDDDENDRPRRPANGAGNGGGISRPPTAALTDTPPVIPAVGRGLDLGPACQQCGGMMQRTGSCYTCSSCGFNTGCG